jgi:hypothetical protein
VFCTLFKPFFSVKVMFLKIKIIFSPFILGGQSSLTLLRGQPFTMSGPISSQLSGPLDSLHVHSIQEASMESPTKGHQLEIAGDASPLSNSKISCHGNAYTKMQEKGDGMLRAADSENDPSVSNRSTTGQKPSSKSLSDSQLPHVSSRLQASDTKATLSSLKNSDSCAETGSNTSLAKRKTDSGFRSADCSRMDSLNQSCNSEGSPVGISRKRKAEVLDKEDKDEKKENAKETVQSEDVQTDNSKREQPLTSERQDEVSVPVPVSREEEERSQAVSTPLTSERQDEVSVPVPVSREEEERSQAVSAVTGTAPEFFVKDWEFVSTLGEGAYGE